MRACGCSNDHGTPDLPKMQTLSPNWLFAQKPFSMPILQYDWTTGVPDNGNEWRKFRTVPRLYPLRSLVCTLFNKGRSRGAFRLPGAGGDHFHCTVEPSPGHIRCRHLSFWRFFPQFYSTFWPNLGAIHVARPIGWFWGLGTPNSRVVLFGPENGLFKLQKHYVLKGKWPILK